MLSAYSIDLRFGKSKYSFEAFSIFLAIKTLELFDDFTNDEALLDSLRGFSRFSFINTKDKELYNIFFGKNKNKKLYKKLGI